MMAYTRKSRRWVAAGVATAFMVTTSALPIAAHASRAQDGLAPAGSLGFSAPTDQQVQDEINLVQAQGIPIRVVERHKVVPAMDVLDHGRKVEAANVPAVEFQVGRMPGEIWPSNAVSTIASHVRVPVGRAPLSLRVSHRAADSSWSINWTDNRDAPADGYANFYFTAHYNLTCQNGGCQANTYMVSHQSYNQKQGETLYAYEENPRCGGAGDVWVVGNGNFNGPETYDYYNFSTCAQGNTYVFFEGYWADATGRTYDECYNDKACPGDYVRY